jgi:response regulator RpfG family c-di-GMP phosphodiesterase
MSDSKYPPKAALPVDDSDTEVARLTRLLQDTRYELEAAREARRQEKLRIAEIVMDLVASSDAGHWTIADRLEKALDGPGHPDNVKP